MSTVEDRPAALGADAPCTGPPPEWTGTHAPVHGVVLIADHIDPTNPQRVYDLDEPSHCKYLYEVVLVDGRAEDIEQFVDRIRLAELWPDLYLPGPVRAAWASTIATIDVVAPETRRSER